MTYRFLSPAQRDLAEAVEYYEQASPGLGLEFLDEIERTVERVLVHPEAWIRVAEHHRRCRMRRFPYGLLYAVEKLEEMGCVLIRQMNTGSNRRGLITYFIGPAH